MREWLYGPFLGGSSYTNGRRVTDIADTTLEDGVYRATSEAVQSMSFGGEREVPFLQLDITLKIVDANGDLWRIVRRYDILNGADVPEINRFAALFGLAVKNYRVTGIAGMSDRTDWELTRLMSRIDPAQCWVEVRNGGSDGRRTEVIVRRADETRGMQYEGKADVWDRNFRFAVCRGQRHVVGQ